MFCDHDPTHLKKYVLWFIYKSIEMIKIDIFQSFIQFEI